MPTDKPRHHTSGTSGAKECATKAIEAFGKLDILINNAGVFPEIAECQDHSVELFDYIIRNNIRTAFLMTKFALPFLRDSGGVVIITTLI